MCTPRLHSRLVEGALGVRRRENESYEKEGTHPCLCDQFRTRDSDRSLGETLNERHDEARPLSRRHECGHLSPIPDIGHDRFGAPRVTRAFRD